MVLVFSIPSAKHLVGCTSSYSTLQGRSPLIPQAPVLDAGAVVTAGAAPGYAPIMLG